MIFVCAYLHIIMMYVEHSPDLFTTKLLLLPISAVVHELIHIFLCLPLISMQTGERIHPFLKFLHDLMDLQVM